MIRNLTAAVIVAVLALTACGGGQAPAAPRVVQKTFKFLPARLEVAAGSKVTWTNRDPVDHTVTSGVAGTASGAFDQPLGKTATAVVSFDEPGAFPYFCSIHHSMRGEIVVTERRQR
jgi:plastocyanin